MKQDHRILTSNKDMTIRLRNGKMKISSWIDQNCKFAAVTNPVDQQIQEGVGEFLSKKDEGDALDFVSKHLSRNLPPPMPGYYYNYDKKKNKIPSKYDDFLKDDSFVMGVVNRVMSNNMDWMRNADIREFLSKNKRALSIWARTNPLEFLKSLISYREIESPDAAFLPLIPLIQNDPKIINLMTQNRTDLAGGSAPPAELSCPTAFKLFEMFAQLARENKVHNQYSNEHGYGQKSGINIYEASSLLYSYNSCLMKWAAVNPVAYLDLSEAFSLYMNTSEAKAFIDKVAALTELNEDQKNKIGKKLNYLGSSGNYDAFETAMEFTVEGSPMEELIVPYAIFANKLSDGSLARIKEFLSKKGDQSFKYFVGEFSSRLGRGARVFSTMEEYMARFDLPPELAKKAYDDFWMLEMGRGEGGNRITMGESLATKLMLDSEIARQSFGAISQSEGVQSKRKWALLAGHLMAPEESRNKFLDAWKSSPSDTSAISYSLALQSVFGNKDTLVFSKFNWGNDSYRAEIVEKIVPDASKEAAKRNAYALYQMTQSGMPNLKKMAKEYESYHLDASSDRDFDEPAHEFKNVRVSNDGRSILLYRGIQAEYEVPNIIESWTSNPITAGSSTFDGHAVLWAWIPVDAILSHFMDPYWGRGFGPRESDCEQEFIVIRSRVNQNLINMTTKNTALIKHSSIADPSSVQVQALPEQEQSK